MATSLLLCLTQGFVPQSLLGAGRQARARHVSVELPAQRSFYMGFSQWPYDFSARATTRTYAAIREHADIIAIHLDGGVPWPEALAGDPFHPAAEADLASKVAEASRFEAVYVAATPLAGDRFSLAAYWGEETNLPLPAAWRGRSLDDPDVIEAYLNYCRRLIALFEPDYFAYGIEVNESFLPGEVGFEQFKTLAASVYTTLRHEYPDLSLLLTFYIGSAVATPEQQQQVSRDLVPYTDIIGVSSYPYFLVSGFKARRANVTYLPDDWFAQMAALAPNKPFAITETGYIAENLEIPEFQVDTMGRARWQRRYINFLLEQVSQLDTVFVIYWEIRDYDRGYRTLMQLGFAQPLFLVWKDIGLLDGRGKKRRGLRRWDSWLSLPRVPTRSGKARGTASAR